MVPDAVGQSARHVMRHGQWRRCGVKRVGLPDDLAWRWYLYQQRKCHGEKVRGLSKHMSLPYQREICLLNVRGLCEHTFTQSAYAPSACGFVISGGLSDSMRSLNEKSRVTFPHFFIAQFMSIEIEWNQNQMY